MSNNLISVENLQYSLGNKNKFSLKIKEFILKKSDSFLIYGDSGSGKSTFLNLLSGTLNPQEGVVKILGKNISESSSGIKDKVRGDHFGIVFLHAFDVFGCPPRLKKKLILEFASAFF